MRLFGYADEGLPIDEIIPATLGEVTLCATPVELRHVCHPTLPSTRVAPSITLKCTTSDGQMIEVDGGFIGFL